MLKFLKTILILLTLCLGLTSCSTIGVKEKVIPIYVTYGQHDEALDGLIRVATNEKLSVTVGDYLTELDVGGYYVISEQDLKAFKSKLQKKDDDHVREEGN